MVKEWLVRLEEITRILYIVIFKGDDYEHNIHFGINIIVSDITVNIVSNKKKQLTL